MLIALFAVASRDISPNSPYRFWRAERYISRAKSSAYATNFAWRVTSQRPDIAADLVRDRVERWRRNRYVASALSYTAFDFESRRVIGFTHDPRARFESKRVERNRREFAAHATNIARGVTSQRPHCTASVVRHRVERWRSRRDRAPGLSRMCGSLSRREVPPASSSFPLRSRAASSSPRFDARDLRIAVNGAPSAYATSVVNPISRPPPGYALLFNGIYIVVYTSLPGFHVHTTRAP